MPTVVEPVSWASSAGYSGELPASSEPSAAPPRNTSRRGGAGGGATRLTTSAAAGCNVASSTSGRRMMYECKGEHSVITSQRWRNAANSTRARPSDRCATPAGLSVHVDQHSLRPAGHRASLELPVPRAGSKASWRCHLRSVNRRQIHRALAEGHHLGLPLVPFS